MDTPPAVIVHSLSDAKRAMAARLPVLLLSAPAAGLFGGCLWWLALLRQAEFKGLSLLDCGDAPGRALEAIRLGVPGVILACEPEIFATAAALAVTKSTRLVAARPPSLDLGTPGAERHLLAWLGG